jgi:hypothetical protein
VPDISPRTSFGLEFGNVVGEERNASPPRTPRESAGLRDGIGT